MVVSGLPIWIVTIIAIVITFVYWLRHRKNSKGEAGIMSNWLVILLVFAGHFFFFAWGVIIFIIAEIIRANRKKASE